MGAGIAFLNDTTSTFEVKVSASLSGRLVCEKVLKPDEEWAQSCHVIVPGASYTIKLMDQKAVPVFRGGKFERPSTTRKITAPRTKKLFLVSNLTFAASSKKVQSGVRRSLSQQQGYQEEKKLHPRGVHDLPLLRTQSEVEPNQSKDSLSSPESPPKVQNFRGEPVLSADHVPPSLRPAASLLRASENILKNARDDELVIKDGTVSLLAPRDLFSFLSVHYQVSKTNCRKRQRSAQASSSTDNKSSNESKKATENPPANTSRSTSSVGENPSQDSKETKADDRLVLRELHIKELPIWAAKQYAVLLHLFQGQLIAVLRTATFVETEKLKKEGKEKSKRKEIVKRRRSRTGSISRKDPASTDHLRILIEGTPVHHQRICAWLSSALQFKRNCDSLFAEIKRDLKRIQSPRSFSMTRRPIGNLEKIRTSRKIDELCSAVCLGFDSAAEAVLEVLIEYVLIPIRGGKVFADLWKIDISNSSGRQSAEIFAEDLIIDVSNLLESVLMRLSWKEKRKCLAERVLKRISEVFVLTSLSPTQNAVMEEKKGKNFCMKLKDYRNMLLSAVHDDDDGGFSIIGTVSSGARAKCFQLPEVVSKLVCACDEFDGDMQFKDLLELCSSANYAREILCEALSHASLNEDAIKRVTWRLEKYTRVMKEEQEIVKRLSVSEKRHRNSRSVDIKESLNKKADYRLYQIEGKEGEIFAVDLKFANISRIALTTGIRPRKSSKKVDLIEEKRDDNSPTEISLTDFLDK